MRRLALLLTSLLALPAAALELTPTTLQLPAAQDRTELWLHNPGPAPWRGRVQIWAWDQQTDAERLQPSDQILASPVLLVLPPGGRQRVWLLPRHAVTVAAEQAFRIILSPDDPHQPRYSLPLFRAPAASRPRPQLRVDTQAGISQTLLRLENTGGIHARVSDLTYVAADGHRSLLLPGLAGYILAARQRQWVLPARADRYQGGHFSARLQDGAEVTLAALPPAIAASQPSGL